MVGSLSTVLNYGCFYLLRTFLGVHYTFASAVGFVSGVIFGCWLNKHWTFQIKDKDDRHLIKYSFVYLGSLILSVRVLHTAIKVTGIHPNAANIMVIGLTTCTNFLGTKLLVFNH